MPENNIMNEKRSLSVDDILSEARKKRAEKLSLKEVSSLTIEETKEEIVEKEEITETVEEAEEIIEAAEEIEEVDELIEIENIEETKALEELSLLDGNEDDEEATEEEAEVIAETEKPLEGKKKKFAEILYEWVGEIVVAVAIVAILFSFFFRVVTVYGDSMLPNFKGNDKLIVSSFLHKIEQGDVVVVTDVLDNPIIKRVIAVGGQTVDIDNETGTVYVDGKALDESAYIKSGITFSNGADKISFPITIKEGYVFALGDNRPISKDSRFSSVGEISEDNILGEVKARVFPFSEFKLYF